jgi:hypothetical protein
VNESSCMTLSHTGRGRGRPLMVLAVLMPGLPSATRRRRRKCWGCHYQMPKRACPGMRRRSNSSVGVTPLSPRSGRVRSPGGHDPQRAADRQRNSVSATVPTNHPSADTAGGFGAPRAKYWAGQSPGCRSALEQDVIHAAAPELNRLALQSTASKYCGLIGKPTSGQAAK